MNFRRWFAFSGAFLLAALLLFSGCKSKTQQQDSQTSPQAQNTQSTANSSQSAGTQPPQPNGSVPEQGGTQTAQAAPAPPPLPPPPVVVTLPSGSRLRVRLVQDLGSKISRTGDSFTATVADDIRINGQIIIPMGAKADGTVIDAKPLGHFKGAADLALRLDQVQTNWGRYAIATSTIDRAKKGKGKRTAAIIGGGTGLGAIIGGIAGGGKGAAIGALAGAGAGTAGSAFTGNKEIVLPAETILTFKLQSDIKITEQK